MSISEEQYCNDEIGRLNHELNNTYAELERVKRQNTVMREALEACDVCLAGARHSGDGRKAIQSALSTDAGRDYIAKDSVRPLAVALKATWDELEMGYIVATGQPSECGECGSIGKHSVHCFQGKIEPALEIARQLGLLEDAQ